VGEKGQRKDDPVAGPEGAKVAPEPPHGAASHDFSALMRSKTSRKTAMPFMAV
jgi:hypothetical protein